MKTIFKILSFVILFVVLIGKSFAIDAPSNLKLDFSSGSSVNLSWDSTENAFMYYVYYAKHSGLEIGYDMQTDFIETNSITVDNLEIGSTYYFTVVALDENGEESIYSNEIIVDIVDSSMTMDSVIVSEVTFALDSINMVASNAIELSFTAPLNDSLDAIREFKITNKADYLDTYEVLSTELNIEDSSKLKLVLDREPEIGKEYEVVIIAITSADGKNIESGIDNIETFTATEILVEDVIIEDIIVEDIIVEENIELNSASEESNGPTGANIDASDVENTTLALASNNDSLPKTGPEHILMLILSIILGALIFIFKYKKV